MLFRYDRKRYFVINPVFIAKHSQSYVYHLLVYCIDHFLHGEGVTAVHRTGHTKSSTLFN